MTFQEFELSQPILDALSDLGFETPTAIQEQAIPVLTTTDTDFIGLAQTGTGKTAAFGLPMLQNLDLKKKKIQAIVLCPTRELCVQISKDLHKFSKYMKDVRIAEIYGGASIQKQQETLQRGVQVMVGTPGRVIDLIERGNLDLSNVSLVILDEADEMLNMGFREELNEILKNIETPHRTWLFSATLSKDIEQIARKYMKDPYEVTAGSRNTAAADITHRYYLVHEKDRYLALKRIIDFHAGIFGIIFCRTKNETQEVAEKLIRDGYNADALHGDLSQPQREKVMNRFRQRSLQLLVATDVAARGIDISDITHVIHYRMPDDFENYTHRSGRTARAGKKGVSIALVNFREVRNLKDLERGLKMSFEKQLIPTGAQVCHNQLAELLNKVTEVEVNEEEIAPFLKKAHKILASLDKDEIIKRFITIEFERFMNYYRNAPDLNEGAQSGKRTDSGNMMRFFVSIGEKDEFNRSSLLRFICDSTGISGRSVGRIDLKQSYSFVEVDASEAKNIMRLSEVSVNSRRVQVEESQQTDSPSGAKHDRKGGGGRSRDDRGYGRQERSRSGRDNDRSFSGRDKGKRKGRR